MPASTLRQSIMFNKPGGTGLARAIRAAVDGYAALDAVPDNSDTAVSAGGHECVNRAFE